MEFKVGDLVIGNAKASEKYGITKKGWKGCIECVNKRSRQIKVSGKGLYGENVSFWVMADCFDLVYEAPQPAPEPEKPFSWEDLF